MKLCEQGVDMLKARNSDLSKQNVDLLKSNSAFYKNPFFLIGLGILAGVVAARR